MAEKAPVQHETTEELRSRRLTTEDMVRAQLVAINAVRNDVQRVDRTEAWSEALEALYDLLYPWWADNNGWQEKWDARRVAVVEVAPGEFVAYPTPQDCRQAQQLLMELLNESEMLVKKRTVSGPSPRDFTPKPVEATA